MAKPGKNWADGVFEDGIFADDVWAQDGVDDTTPNSFEFVDQVNVTPETERVSNLIVVAGLSDGVSVPVAITGGEYSKNGGAYTSEEGTAQNGDTFKVKHTSSAEFETAVNTALTIGGVSDTFTSTTYEEGFTAATPRREASLRGVGAVRGLRSMTVR